MQNGSPNHPLYDFLADRNLASGPGLDEFARRLNRRGAKNRYGGFITRRAIREWLYWQKTPEYETCQVIVAEVEATEAREKATPCGITVDVLRKTTRQQPWPQLAPPPAPARRVSVSRSSRKRTGPAAETAAPRRRAAVG